MKQSKWKRYKWVSIFGAILIVAPFVGIAISEIYIRSQPKLSQTAKLQPPPAKPAVPIPVPVIAPVEACANPKAMGVTRVVEINTTGGPGFGFEHFKQYDFLKDHEVVLTFDDGPWPVNTPAILKALADQCVKAIFFPIGQHALWHPAIMKQVVAGGHSIGTHTWSHKDLSKLSNADALAEIEKGASAVHAAADAPTAPFFRFPALRQPPELLAYLGTRNIAIWSTDYDSFDFKIRKPEAIVDAVMKKLSKTNKGIVLMHDFQHGTALALPALLARLQTDGYKIVFVKPKTPITTIASYDEDVKKALSGGVTSRPIGDVIRTIQ